MILISNMVLKGKECTHSDMRGQSTSIHHSMHCMFSVCTQLAYSLHCSCRWLGIQQLLMTLLPFHWWEMQAGHSQQLHVCEQKKSREYVEMCFVIVQVPSLWRTHFIEAYSTLRIVSYNNTHANLGMFTLYMTPS